MMGRPSPRKDQHTRKAEQVSWLAARLTLCAFPLRVSRNSGSCRFQRRSQLRGSNGFSLPASSGQRRDTPFSLEDPSGRDHSASPIRLSDDSSSSHACTESQVVRIFSPSSWGSQGLCRDTLAGPRSKVRDQAAVTITKVAEARDHKTCPQTTRASRLRCPRWVRNLGDED